MNGNASSTVLSGHANQRNLSDMTLTELQEIAMRQQQQIEINQQLLHAKEKRLKSLKQEDTKQYQMITQQQQQQPQPQSTKDMQKLEALKQSVLSQELKIFKLKQLRNQILEYKLSNANMYSELDLIKSLFDQKERELFGAISKVAELSKQIEQLRKLKQKNNHQNSAALNTSQDQQQAMSAASSHITELERLKQELQIRNKLNEQQAKKIITQQDQFNKKQIEVLALDKRIEELKDRIAAKRNYLAATNNQQLTAAPQQQQQHIQAPPQPPPHAQIHPHPYHHYNQNVPPNNLASNVRTLHTPAFDSAPQQLPQQQQQSQSPSKLVAKFATKQEIANTYMNKYNSDAYQKYQARMFQQQQQQQQHSPSSAQHSPQVADQQQQQIKPSIEEVLGETGAAQSSSYSAQSSSMSISSNAAVNGTAPTTANAARPESSSSSLVSLSPISNASNNLVAQQQTVAVKGCRKASYDAPSQSQLAFMMANNAKLEDSSTLPSHLKLEFDKIKYLPDVVKTIKKRHSISEIESSNTLPPQIFQKILEKHHKNFLDQHGSLTDQMLVAPSSSSSNSTIAQASKLNKITEVSETAAPSPTQPAQQQQSPPQQQQQQQSNQQVKLSTFMPQTAKQPQVQTQQQQQQQQQLPQIQPTEQIEVIESTTIKSTKSIIKTTPSSTQLSTDATESNTITASRRVNFDPHALLLDAAVEGELELVMRCAKQVRDISQPNDEGITALHNSVCAGHFGIVKFLVEYGCDINYADNDGWTPLHCAASCNNLQMIRFLIENGASLFATTLSDNETAIRKCEEDEEGFQPCYEYLAQAQEQLGNDGGFVYSLYDYEAQNEDELTFTCNQRLVVVDKCEGEDDANDGWWLCRLDNGQEGLVPKNYLGLYPRVRPGCESRAQEESTIC